MKRLNKSLIFLEKVLNEAVAQILIKDDGKFVELTEDYLITKLQMIDNEFKAIVISHIEKEMQNKIDMIKESQLKTYLIGSFRHFIDDDLTDEERGKVSLAHKESNRNVQQLKKEHQELIKLKTGLEASH